jgi:transcriptional antiterminator NusG
MTRKEKQKLRRNKGQRVKRARLAGAQKRAQTRIRQKLARFTVDDTRTWYIARVRPRWAHRVVQQLTEAGIPVFQANDEVTITGRDGRKRQVRAPLLRRIVFFGAGSPVDLDHAADHPGMERVMFREGRALTVAPADLQVFADFVTGHAVDEDDANRALYKLGQQVRVADGPFASFNGIVEWFDPRTGVYKVGLNVFGRVTPIELEEHQLDAA